MTVMEIVGNQSNKESEGTALMETDRLESSPSALQPTVTEKSPAGQLPVTIPNLLHHTFVQGLEEPGDESVAPNSLSDEFESLKRTVSLFGGSECLQNGK